jgi:hypothetical protein
MQGGLLKAERKLIRSRSPVKFIQGDVTEWAPPPALRHNFDVVLSDMAPKTTGAPDHDSMVSMELCHSVLDLCSRIIKPPFTRSEPLSDADWDRVKLDFGQEQIKVANADAAPSGADVREMVAQEVRMLSDRKQVSLEEGAQDPAILRRALRHNATTRHKPSAAAADVVQLSDADRDSYVGPVRVEGPWLRQVRRGRDVHTYYHGTLLMKVFQGEHFAALMRRVKTLFTVVHTFKPTSSRSESVEVFIYARGYRGPLEHHAPGAQDVTVPADAPEREETEAAPRAVSRKREKKAWPSTREHATSIAEARGDGVGLVDDAAVYQPRYGAMSVEDIYAQLGYGADAAFTNEEMARTEGLRKAYHDAAASSDVGAAVRSSIQARSLRADMMRPPELHFDVRDPETAAIRMHNEFLGQEDAGDDVASAARTVLVDTESASPVQDAELHSIYGSVALNRVPTPEELAQAMSLYWDEGMDFADELQREHGYKEHAGFENFDEDE